MPNAGTVAISLPENLAIDAGGAGNHASNPVSITYRTAYEQWAFDYGIDGTAASLMADDDHDGIEQLLEFAFNLDPTAADGNVYDPTIIPGSGLPGMIVSEVGGPAFSLQFLARKDIPGLSYEAQFGSALDDFSSVGTVPTVLDLGSGWQRVTVPDPAPDGQSRRFGRVVVTLSSP